MRLTLLSSLLLATVASASADRQSDDGERVRKIWEIVRDVGDETPRSLLRELGTIGTRPAFLALQRSLREMKERPGKEAVFDAMRPMLANEELAPLVLELALESAKGREDALAHAAAAALARYGDAATPALFDVAKRGHDSIARAIALAPLLDELALRHDDVSRDLLLKSYIVPYSGTDEQGFAVLRCFRRPADFDVFARFVRNGRESLAKKRLVVVAMGGHRTVGSKEVVEGSAAVLLAALQDGGDALRYEALRSIARRGGPGSARSLSEVQKLAESRDPTVRRAAILALDSAGVDGYDAFVLASSTDPIRRQAGALALGRDGSTEALNALRKLLEDADPVVRAEAVRSMAKRRDKRSIADLILRLQEEEGRLREDVRSALVALTARDYGHDAGTWRRFWKKEGARFVVPSIAEVARVRVERDARRESSGTRAEFYGLDIVSHRFALVIDTSGSMEAPAYPGRRRIDVAREQLKDTITRLRDGVEFDVIPFNDVAYPMHGKLKELDDARRKEALSKADRLRAGGATNLHDALEAAFQDPRVDTIYILSDGDPTAGALQREAELRNAVTRWNSVRGIVIHSVAVGQDRDLLNGLARDSGGEYRRVDY